MTQLNNEFKVFKKYRGNGHLFTLLLSMYGTKTYLHITCVQIFKVIQFFALKNEDLYKFSLLLFAQRGDLAFSTRKVTEKAAQVGAGPESEGQRKEESEESSKPGQVVPTGPAQRVGSSGKGSGRGVWWCEGLSRRRDKGLLGSCPSSPGNC